MNTEHEQSTAQPSRRGSLTAISGPVRNLAAISLAVLVISGSGAPVGQAAGEVLAAGGSGIAAATILRDVDGGGGFYGGFTSSLPATSDYFPVGVWLESIVERDNVARDKDAGLNTYVGLTSNSDLSLLSDSGLFALTNGPSPLSSGLVLADEPDMWGGPGASEWTGKWPGHGEICNPAGTRCGYSIQQKLSDATTPGSLKYANYGKGVSFWETNEEAAVFINHFQDVVSADNYWFTDPNICGQSEGGTGPGKGRSLTHRECRLAANYGWTVDRVRSLMKPAGAKPVWALVELGHPATESTAPTITGPQIRAAVWSSIIHGARGIVYFNHSFGGSCISQHVLRDACGAGVRPLVTILNKLLAELAPVLNAPFLDNVLAHGAGVDTAVKVYNGSLYVLAGAAQPDRQMAELTMACLAGTTTLASVVQEGRTVTISNGVLRDVFDDGNAVHLYKLEGAAAACVP